MSRKRGSEAVIEYLDQTEAPYLFFGPIGHTNFELWHAIEEMDAEIDPIETRNEFIAGYMAAGWFRATGEPAILSAHTTPGLGLLAAPMSAAYVNSDAIVNISSAPPAKWWGRSPHHEVPPYSRSNEIHRPITKKTWSVNDPDRVYEVLNYAFSASTSGKPGPTLITLAADLLGEHAEYGPAPDPSKHIVDSKPIADSDAIAEAATALAAAEKPVILAGGGARISRSTKPIVELAEWLSVPVATTDSGKGTIPETHDLSVGVVGVSGSRVANTIVADSDVVLAVGTRFKELTTAAWNPEEIFSFPEQDLLQLDINPEEIGKYYPVDTALVGDATRTLSTLVEEVKDETSSRTDRDRMERVDSLKEEWQQEFQECAEQPGSDVHIANIIKSLQEILDDDAILSGGAGRNKSAPAQLYSVSNPDSMLLDTGVGIMGASPGYALGAQLAHPDRDVVCIEGDGGMHISFSAVATAREYDLPITFVVFNDSAYSGISSLQKAYVGEPMGTEFDMEGDRYDVDFAKMAEAYGVASTQVTERGDLHDSLETAIDADEPYLVDVLLPRESPSPEPGVDWGLPGRGEGTWER